MMDNIYTPPKFRTVMPPNGHLRTTPNYTQITDFDRIRVFTNFNRNLLEKIRQIKHAQL